MTANISKPKQIKQGLPNGLIVLCSQRKLLSGDGYKSFLVDIEQIEDSMIY